MAIAEIHYTLNHNEFTPEERLHIARRLGESVLFFSSEIALSRIEQPINGEGAEYLPAELEHNLSCDMADFRNAPPVAILDGTLSVTKTLNKDMETKHAYDSYKLTFEAIDKLESFGPFDDEIMKVQQGIERSFGSPLQERLDGESGVLIGA